MGKRQREWARKERDRILVLLGEVCASCKETKDLEFDVIIPNNTLHSREYEWSWRMSYYRKQLEMNNLQLLCAKCNNKKNNRLVLSNSLLNAPDCPF